MSGRKESHLATHQGPFEARERRMDAADAVGTNAVVAFRFDLHQDR